MFVLLKVYLCSRHSAGRCQDVSMIRRAQHSRHGLQGQPNQLVPKQPIFPWLYELVSVKGECSVHVLATWDQLRWMKMA